MNEILKSTANNENTITSLEVAEMVGKEHSKLLKDIRRYSEQLAEAKIGLGDFFTESTYFDNKKPTLRRLVFMRYSLIFY